MEYSVTLTQDDNDTVLVTFPDVEGAVTFGDTIEEALTRAPEALATILEAYIKDRRPIPPPSARRTKYRVTVPALVEAKIRLYEAMRAAKVGKAELGRRLDWHLPQVDRLLAMTHGSKLEQLEAAFGALGKRLVVGVEDVPAAPSRRRIAKARAARATHGQPRRPSRPLAR